MDLRGSGELGKPEACLDRLEDSLLDLRSGCNDEESIRDGDNVESDEVLKCGFFIIHRWFRPYIAMEKLPDWALKLLELADLVDQHPKVQEDVSADEEEQGLIALVKLIHMDELGDSFVGEEGCSGGGNEVEDHEAEDDGALGLEQNWD